jgi:hypothetical protein
MTLNSANVLVALTGSVLVGPVGTTLPTTTDATWDTDFVDLGYISEDGITEAHDDQTAEIKAWQNGDVVRSMITGSSATYSFTVIETTAAALSLYYKGSTLTGTGDGPATIEVKTPTAERHAFGFDVIDGLNIVRWTIAEGEVSERGDITYKNDEPIAFELTVTAYPGADGVHTTKIISALDGLPAGP